MIDEFNIRFSDNITLLPPLGFKEALFLWKDAALVMTDSGGLHVMLSQIKNGSERFVNLRIIDGRLICCRYFLACGCCCTEIGFNYLFGRT